MSCPSGAELERGFFTEDGSVAAHARSCASCGRAFAEIQALKELARSVASSPRADHRRERVRNALVSPTAAVRRPPRWPFAAAALIAATSAAFVLIPREPEPVLDRDPAPEHRGWIVDLDSAQLALMSAQPDEVVRLYDGSIGVEVETLDEGKRFRVIVGDAEVEVRGTAFDVTARDDRLEEVAVHQGVVEVRRAGEVTLLRVGDVWRKREDVVKGIWPPKRVRRVRDRSYEMGWAALRDERFEEAAESFARASRNPSLRQDARYFLGVSQARAGDTSEAMETFETFLRDHSGSARSGEVAAMLGWMYFDRDALDRAHALFTAASASSDSARVTSSAARGLEAIRRRRSK